MKTFIYPHRQINGEGEGMEKRKKLILLLLVIFTAAFLIRSINISYENFWIDEGVTVYSDSAGSVLEVFKNAQANSYLPFYHIMLHQWMAAFGMSEFAARSLSALIGALSAAALFFMADRLFERKAALISTAIVLVSPFHVSYSQEARSYAMLFLLSALSFYFFISYLKEPEKKNLALYGIFTLMFLLTHPLAPVMLIAQNMIFFSYVAALKAYKRAVQWIIAQSLVGAAALPFYYFLLPSLNSFSKTSWIPIPGIKDLVKAFYFFSAGTTKTALSLAAGIALCAIFAFLLLRLLYNEYCEYRKSGKIDINTAVLFGWLILPMLIFFTASQVLQPTYVIRYFIYSLAPFIMLSARSISSMKKPLGTAAILAITILSVAILSIDFSFRNKEDWKSVSEYLDKNMAEEDLVYVNTPYSIYSLAYYHDKECFASRDLLGCMESKGIKGVANAGEIDRDEIRGKSAYLVLFNSKYTDPDGSLLRFFSQGYGLDGKAEPTNIEIYHFIPASQ